MRQRNQPQQTRRKRMRKLLDLLGDVMLMLCVIAGISVMELVFVYLVVELSK
mgnify:CR=1 FL=1